VSGIAPGSPGMVDITSKDVILRRAVACGSINLSEYTIKLIRDRRVDKGDPLEVARVAATLAVKNTPQIIPYCHPIPIESVKVIYDVKDKTIDVCVEVKAQAKTGVEMEALVGVTTALLTIWDMVKKYEKDERGLYPRTSIGSIRVVEKEKQGAHIYGREQ